MKMKKSIRRARAMIPGIILAAAAPAPLPAQAGPPEWFTTEMRRMANDGDRWITDNAPYVSDQEPWDHYGMEWKWVMDGIAISGRLFGLRDGSETTFWDFRMYWDAGAGAAMIVQIGVDGRIAEGSIRQTGNGEETESDQTLRLPDGSTSRIRHLATTTAATHTTRSFDWVAGKWEERRTYVWRRTPGDGPATRPATR